MAGKRERADVKVLVRSTQRRAARASASWRALSGRHQSSTNCIIAPTQPTSTMRALSTSSAWSSRAICHSCRVRVATPLVRRQNIHISEAPSSSTPSFDQDVSAAASSTPGIAPSPKLNASDVVLIGR